MVGPLVAARDGGEDRHRGRLLEKKDVAGTGTEVCSPATGERLDVERRIPKPCRIIDDEGESAEEHWYRLVPRTGTNGFAI